MKKTLKVYFDFLCPYCYKGVMNLLALLPDYPELKVNWMPCEAHPKPEVCSQYSDIASEAFLYIKGHNGDVIPFIEKVYKSHYEDGQRIDDKDFLADACEMTGVDPKALKASLIRRDYKQDVMSINDEVWNVYMLDAVPSYHCRNKSLRSKENQMISIDELKEFLNCL